MTLTAHVPASEVAAERCTAAATPFSSLGAGLVQLGLALQLGDTTVGDLVKLAQACGITLHIRVTDGKGAAHG